MVFAILLAAIAPASASLPDVTYDEAVACSFLGMGIGLSDTHSREEQREIIGLAVRYMQAAKEIGGRTDSEVVDDMAAAGDLIAAEIDGSTNPRQELDARWMACVDNSENLPAAES
ncbi:hypothetical protein [Aurantiacibacter sp. MUD61]|uniref:hypothetical protein n=1 Tax=Aurantiacibacter sp. MUD61 TaxID=3009083 RepID=UPI0022EFDD83|nr:hypothetical protein [Aurantiacibacter sp. MUD61]